MKTWFNVATLFLVLGVMIAFIGYLTWASLAFIFGKVSWQIFVLTFLLVLSIIKGDNKK